MNQNRFIKICCSNFNKHRLNFKKNFLSKNTNFVSIIKPQSTKHDFFTFARLSNFVKADSHQMLRSADSSVDNCVALQRQKNSNLCANAVHCRISTSVNEPLVGEISLHYIIKYAGIFILYLGNLLRTKRLKFL